MNRVIIKIDANGHVCQVASDTECRVIIFDPACKSEPFYEFTEGVGKKTGVNIVREMIGDNLLATMESDGPWKDGGPTIGIIK